jgi:type VI secretion system protein ImpA
MPYEPLNCEEFLAPIPGDNPAGETTFAIRDKLKEDRRSNPEELPEPKRSDWLAIIRDAKKILKETSKDLLVGAYLTEALTRQGGGFAGARDGIRLLRLMVEQCWDRLNPSIEDGDVSTRLGPFHFLDDVESGARFPTTLRMLPLVKSGDIQFSWLDWSQAQGGKGEVSRDDIERAIQACPAEVCQQTATEINESLAEVNALTQALATKVGEFGESPAFTGVRPALEECQGLMTEIVRRKGAALGDEAAVPAANGAAAPAAGRGAAGAPGSRAAAYQQLEQAAAVLEKLEPHSPIPFFVRRAVELGKKPFPDMIRELIRDANVLAELYREMGIRAEGGAPSE